MGLGASGEFWEVRYVGFLIVLCRVCFFGGSGAWGHGKREEEVQSRGAQKVVEGGFFLEGEGEVAYQFMRSKVRVLANAVSSFVMIIASVWKACNWAAWTFVFGSWGMYEYCQRKREMELKGMKRAMEIVERKKIEKERKAEEVRAARRKAKEEGDKRKDEEEKRREAEEKRRKGSWRFWA